MVNSKQIRPKSIIKIANMYEYYLNMQKEIKDACPKVFPYINKSYYQEEISSVFDVTTNYISTCFNKIEANPKEFKKLYQEALNKVQELRKKQ